MHKVSLPGYGMIRQRHVLDRPDCRSWISTLFCLQTGRMLNAAKGSGLGGFRPVTCVYADPGDILTRLLFLIKIAHRPDRCRLGGWIGVVGQAPDPMIHDGSPNSGIDPCSWIREDVSPT